VANRVCATNRPPVLLLAALILLAGDDAAVTSVRTAWELARRRAKLEDIRFHDLRSGYASSSWALLDRRHRTVSLSRIFQVPTISPPQ